MISHSRPRAQAAVESLGGTREGILAAFLKGVHTHQWRLLLATVGLGSLVLTLAQVPPASLVDNWLSDTGQTMQTAIFPREPSVMLVNTDGHSDFEVRWAELIPNLLSRGVRNVVFVGPPAGLSQDVVDQWAEKANIFFGVGSSTEWRRLMAFDGIPKSHIGSTRIIPAKHGITRQLPRDQTFDDQQIMGLPELVAGHRQDLAPETRVSFSVERLPQVQLSDLIDGAIAEVLLDGRTLVFGVTTFTEGAGITTALGTQVSAPEYLGFSIDALINGRLLSTRLHPLMVACTFGLVIGFLIVHQLLNFRSGVRLAVLANLGCVLVAFATAWAAGYWIPLTAMIATPWLAIAYVFSHRRYGRDLAMGDMHARILARTSRTGTALGGMDRPNHWQLFSQVINQIFLPERFALVRRLQPAAGQGDRLEVAEQKGCSDQFLSQLLEHLAAWPEAGTTELDQSIEVDAGHLDALYTDEKVLLQALSFGGDVLGYVAVTFVGDEKAPNPLDGHRQALMQLAPRMAQRIQAENLAVTDRRDGGVLSRLFAMEAPVELHKELDLRFGELERHAAAVDGVIETMSGAIVVYDVLGSVIEASRAMEIWAEGKRIPIYQLNAYEFIDRVAGDCPGVSREFIQRVSGAAGEMRTLIVDRENSSKIHRLYAKALVTNSDSELTRPEVTGFFFEMHDVSDVVERFQRREEFVRHLNQSVAEQLRLLSKPDEKSGYFKALKLAYRHVRQIDDSLQDNLMIGHLARYPVAMSEILDHLSADLRQQLALKSLQLELGVPDTTFVLADFRGLLDVLRNLAEVLIDDAPDGSIISVRLKGSDSQTHDLSLRSFGFGMPTERLRAYLAASTRGDSSPLARLSRDRELIALWGGRLRASSWLGEGIDFSIKLQSFDANAFDRPLPALKQAA